MAGACWDGAGVTDRCTGAVGWPLAIDCGDVPLGDVDCACVAEWVICGDVLTCSGTEATCRCTDCDVDGGADATPVDLNGEVVDAAFSTGRIESTAL